MFEYRKAIIEDLERIWDKDIAENSGDPRYPEWKTQFINANKRKIRPMFYRRHNLYSPK